MSFEQQMQQALRSFIVEAQELLEGMEHGLMELEPQGGANAAPDGERINALFRAAHTIKGSAGLFGLDGIVHFTHHLESVLDQMRAGKLAVSSELVALLLQGRDHLAQLVDQVDTQGACIADTPQEQALVARLQAAQQPAGGTLLAAADATASPVPIPAEAAPVTVLPQGAALTGNWHLSLRFGPDSLRNGMDPLAFIRYLRGLGEIVNLVTLTDALPPLDAMDAETSYLGFEINFRSEASKEDIAAVFEFVQQDSLIRILPAHSRIADYVELIRSLPEDDLRLGEILVQVGTLTQKELNDALAAQHDAQASGGSAAPLGEILVREGATHQPIVQAALDKQRQVKEKRSRDSQMLRVTADKLDALINLVGELVIASAGNALHAQNATQREAAAQITRLVEDIRERALKLRMVEIGETFARFQRVVRDVSRELGKDIALVIEGADTEMDKTLVERIADPLMHLVRNAMDHGIETPEVRTARGKPAQGTLRLAARHDSGSILITVADDGGGLNRERILAKAVERGLVSAETAAALPDAEVWNLIFAPGFSTAEVVTDLSGRGVGMDVVKRNIEAIRGSIDIQSSAGAGTQILLRLPLTLAIIDGFLVQAAGRTFVLPLDTVIECMEFAPAQRQGYINLRGEVLPLLHLRDALELAEPGAGAPSARRHVVVVQTVGQRAGLVVDALLGEYQTVIKPLGALFAHLQGISGSTILGNGEVALILDAATLIHRASRSAQARPAPLTTDH
ncbi:MAG: chemotaxis protein CheA [Thiomonas sp.]|uniref:chemotaxis protein CheA n=1 Tax=Thiomonas sp. TaxID=2047785 RepID=UPI002A35AEDA|nr:chemotaxis protein CheA [Thiomonas sp.]MDY0329694.1 chemotaxis protein CheA [Thiomonas sp.]